MPEPELFVGLISGTSRDGVDAALVEFGQGSRVLAVHTHPIPGELRQRLIDCDAGTGLLEVARLDHAVGELFAAAVNTLLNQARVPRAAITAIGSHGQTLWHQPSEGITVQVGDPSLIAERTGLSVVADFRRRDLAAGGQGAPLVPAFHLAVLGSPTENRVILNLGGIANVTVLPAGAASAATAFDTGPASTLLDAWIRRHRSRPYDDGGRWAGAGQVDTALLERLAEDEYFQLPPPKSTGFEYFNPDWLEARLEQELRAVDVQATLAELTALTVAQAVADHAPNSQRILVCGGGSHNKDLLRRLEARLPAGCRLDSTATLGIDPDYVEACAFAWLAQQHLAGRPGNQPAATGAAGPRVLGGFYPR